MTVVMKSERGFVRSWAPSAESVRQADLDEINARFAGAHPRDVLEWGFASIDGLVIGTGFQVGGLVNIHIARDIVEHVPVLFLQTGFHFPETEAFRDKLVRDWDLELIETKPTFGPEMQAEVVGPELYKTDPDLCCHLNKVMPLEVALTDRGGWATGVRRDQSPSRAKTQLFERQELTPDLVVWKLNPLAHWTRAQVDEYARDNDVPRHPLYEKGYVSIGCAPCTKPVGEGVEDERAGRWEGLGKTECGIHGVGGLQGSGHDEEIHAFGTGHGSGNGARPDR
jgi:phosphoadenosine phosphosulfate reductase